MNIFDHTTRPDTALLYRRDDPNDLRLGETVSTDPDDYPDSDVILLGLPQDEGVRRNKGRPGAKDAPDAIRRCLYRFVTIDGLRLFDLGNTIIRDTLEATHEAHREIVRRVLHDGKRLVVLGGGNDTSYPDCSALAMTTDRLLAFNIDAHFDVRADAIRNSGTPYRQLLEEGYLDPAHFYEVAYQPFANSPAYIEYLAETGVTAFPLAHVHEVRITPLLRQVLNDTRVDAFFWGLDMDVVRAADAPGVSAVNPTGLSGAEFSTIGSIAGQDRRTRIFEITEVNPSHDIDERTCRLAAATIWNFLAAVQAGHGS